MKAKHIYILFSIAVTLLIILTLSLNIPANYSQDYFIYPDANSYVISAGMLYKDHFTPHFVRPIGWPVIIGLPYLFNPDISKNFILNFSIFLNFLAWIGSIYFLYKTVSRYTSQKIAFFVAGVFVLLISNILLIYQSMTEGIFVFLLIISSYHLLKYAENGGKKHLLLCSLFIFYSAITRPANFYPAVVTLIISIVLVRKSIGHVLGIIAIFLFTIGLQCYLIQQTYGKPVISFIKNHTAYYYLFARVEYFASPGKWENYEVFYNEREDKANTAALQDSAKNNGKSVWPYLDNYYKENVSYNIKNNFAVVIEQLLLNIKDNSTQGSNFLYALKAPSGNNVFKLAKAAVMKITKYENILMTLIVFVNWLGLFLIFVRKKAIIRNPIFRSILLLQILCSYFLLTSGISYWQGDRFNYVFSPLTLIVCAYLYHAWLINKGQSFVTKTVEA